MNRLYDRFWWWSNHKPAAKWVVYLSIMIIGFVSGMTFLMGLLLLASKVWFIGGGIIIMSLGYATWFYFSDKRNGYVDAYYQGYLKYRERIGKKLGKDV